MAAQRPRGRNGRRAKAAASPLSLRERVGVRGGRESLRVSRSPRLPVACANRGGCAAKCLRSTWNPPARIPFFFRRRGMSTARPIVRAGCRRRPIFLVDNHLGGLAGLTSVGIDGKNTLLARGGIAYLAGHDLTQSPKRPTQSETLLQSARSFRNTDDFRGTFLGTTFLFQGDSWRNVLFPAQFLEQCPTCATKSGEMFLEKPRFQQICFKT